MKKQIRHCPNGSCFGAKLSRSMEDRPRSSKTSGKVMVAKAALAAFPLSTPIYVSEKWTRVTRNSWICFFRSPSLERHRMRQTRQSKHWTNELSHGSFLTCANPGFDIPGIRNQSAYQAVSFPDTQHFIENIGFIRFGNNNKMITKGQEIREGTFCVLHRSSDRAFICEPTSREINFANRPHKGAIGKQRRLFNWVISPSVLAREWLMSGSQSNFVITLRQICTSRNHERML